MTNFILEVASGVTTLDQCRDWFRNNVDGFGYTYSTAEIL